ncbi:CRP/FNR family transcriptional regulator, anaerobic regulatory protein/CRP/FNR family transcriptional regulator, nitrogen fixation regulation protein [Puniceibacterium sediminis]|uniref:CRP/FNR family transcriptional regulator, anaerobic regulatory protein/CRP/FNR family transcriptional regulator, nitrogen fixation regulation protein n=2 Tax=Puniceibacterium sediminis TaxID=1608407 RepID=A0A238ZN91_9RHOB|nr:CRP/FNR family transcriptional regulator, anaerobic regulatory protein/CRP/FNR family transcriptional regulator, nitrogen fixation regulation protein [Puniceibacterium sediminis]
MYVTLSIEAADTITRVGTDFSSRPQASAHPQRQHAAGTHLFREGDHAANVYEVKSGVLRLTRVLENGRRQVIAFGLPGDIIGFPNGDLHHTDCDVIATAEIITHRRSALETSEGDPETHQRLLRAALREISAMQDHFMMLARKSAIEKVASFLIVLSQRTGVPIGNYTTFSLPMSRADIADFLGLTIETVSRSFSLLRKNGTIALETPQTVLVRDMQSLLDLSESTD